MKLNLPLELVHRGQVFTRIDLDIKSTLLIMDTMIRKEFDSAEFVLNHSQRISVVTGTSSVYGVLEGTRLTSTHAI